MNKVPVVSVWMVTYNHEKFLTKALESILEQKTDFDFEIVIGEDCSTDKTRSILKTFEEKYPNIIKPIYQSKNIGALRNAFEFCFPNLKGKYIACLEGDDYWTDNLKLQKQVDFLEANPEYGLTHGDVNHYYENKGKFLSAINKTSKAIIPQGNIFEHLIKPKPLFIKTATVCFRKELAEKYFDYNLAIKENWPLTDLPMWMDIAYHSKVHYFNEVFATYRLLNESASRTQNPKKKFEFHQGVFNIQKHYCTKYNCSETVKNLLLEEFHKVRIRDAYKLKNKSMAMESYRFLVNNNNIVTFKEKIIIATLHLKLILSFIFLKRILGREKDDKK